MPFPPSQRAARGFGPAFSYKMELQFHSLLKKAIETGIRVGTDQANIERRDFFNALNLYRSGKGGSRSIASANQRIAKLAQAAVLESYDERVTRATNRFAPYRIGQNRFSGGALRRALENPNMFVGSYQGIVFMNVAILDREAAHWARLNWGAGSVAGNGPFQPKRVFLSVFGQLLGTLTPVSYPQPAFKMPPGFFIQGEAVGGMRGGAKWGTREPGFYPIRGRPVRYLTKGIQARRFFDAAYVSIGQNLPREYQSLLREWVAQARSTRPRGLVHRSVVSGNPLGTHY